MKQSAWCLRIAERFPMIASFGSQAKKWKGCGAGLVFILLELLSNPFFFEADLGKRLRPHR
ncbi:hypothetical protein [Bacillus pseudomycoides]|uniref:hypothetical protein n=1 Tax=Bacillus pseudomycoides TaxID=64104 RepID=UPI001145895D|nr:hypothetical protein [Bacillus pseudomycoides]